MNVYKHKWQVKGQFVLEISHNTDQLICSFTDWVITKLLEAKSFLRSK
jgi:hypothetical protein